MEFRKGVFVKFYRGENHSFGSGVELDLQGYNLLRVRSLPPAVVSAVMHNFFPLVNVQKSEFLSILYLKKNCYMADPQSCLRTLSERVSHFKQKVNPPCLGI